LETLVAIAVLILSMTAAFYVAQTGLSLSISSRNEVTAFYLAQEAIEFVRNIRDENSLNGQSWLLGIADSAADPCYFGNYCAVDSPNKTIVTCGSTAGLCPALRQDQGESSSTFGMYGLDSLWALANFRRELFIKQINANEIALTVTLYWTKGVLERQFVVHDNLLNWQR